MYSKCPRTWLRAPVLLKKCKKEIVLAKSSIRMSLSTSKRSTLGVFPNSLHARGGSSWTWKIENASRLVPSLQGKGIKRCSRGLWKILYKYKQKERRSYIISHPSLISEILKFKNSLKFPNLTPKYAELLKFLGLKSSLENIIKMNIRCFTEEIKVSVDNGNKKKLSSICGNPGWYNKSAVPCIYSNRDQSLYLRQMSIK